LRRLRTCACLPRQAPRRGAVSQRRVGIRPATWRDGDDRDWTVYLSAANQRVLSIDVTRADLKPVRVAALFEGQAARRRLKGKGVEGGTEK